MSLASSTPAPTSTTGGPGTGETTVVWTNVSDLLAGSPGPTVTLPVSLQLDGSLPLGSLSLSGQAYASTAPRLIPVFDANGTVSDTTNFAFEAIADTVELVPFT